MISAITAAMAKASYRLPGNLRGQGLVGIIVGGLAVYAIVLSLIELVGAVELRAITGNFLQAGNTDDPLYESGSSLGFYAALFFTLNFLLSTRWHWMERLIGGAGRVYALHAFAGKTVLTFVLLHTGILLIQALPNWTLLGNYLLPGRDWAYTLGLVGTLGVLILVALTIWIRLPYRGWLKTHKWMIVPFLGGTLHAVVLQADWYMILMAVLGTYAWLDTVFLLPRRGTKATVTSARTLGDIRELTLKPHYRFSSAPGTFVLLGHNGSRHPFSISGMENGAVRVSVKMAGPFTRNLTNVAQGDTLTLHGPYGHFGSKIMAVPGPQIWIAGGIGITPFLSTLQALSAKADNRPIHLIWSVRGEDDAVYRAEIEALIGHMPMARLTIHDSRDQGRLVAQMAMEGQMESHVFICGPQSMVHELEAQCLDLGMSPERVTSERFAFR